MLPKTDPLLPLLGLCALLAASSTAQIALILGGATLIALAASHAAFAALRRLVPETIRLVLYVLVLATVVTAIGLSMQAWLPQLHASAGRFLPLVVANCAVLGRGGLATTREALLAGIACLGALLLLGVLREWLGDGALFPPLAFVGLALLLALRNRWRTRA